jgi:hypothetical protein
MANPSNLGAMRFADEASFGEASTTFDERLEVIAPIDISGLTQELEMVDPQVQYQNDGALPMRGVQGGSFTVSLYLCGHGSATTGAITATAEENFISRCIGNLDNTSNGGVVNSVSDSEQFTTTGVTVNNGGLIRVGTLGDGRGEGQYQAVKVNGTMTLHTALGASPVADDVIYTPAMIYPSEAGTSASITSQRIEIITANQSYQCHGCYPTGIAISGLNPGEIPKIDITMGVARWGSSSSTFPTVTSVNSFVPSPVAAGSFFFNTFGTGTRVTYGIRDFTLNIEMGVMEIRGPGATNAHQVIIGARRTKCQASFSFTVDSDVKDTTTWEDVWNTSEASQTFKHCLYTCSAGRDGGTLGFYFPKVHITGARPTQIDMDGINRQTVNCRAVTSSAATNNIEKANFIMGLG